MITIEYSIKPDDGRKRSEEKVISKLLVLDGSMEAKIDF